MTSRGVNLGYNELNTVRAVLVKFILVMAKFRAQLLNMLAFLSLRTYSSKARFPGQAQILQANRIVR
jgi:hypothetical protein